MGRKSSANAVEGTLLLCGVADVEADEHVVAYAADLAERLGARLVLLHAKSDALLAAEPHVAYAAGCPARRDQRATAERLARLAAETGIGVAEIRLLPGDLEAGLLAVAVRERPLLTVVGGQLPRRLAGRSPVPSVVVPRGFQAGDPKSATDTTASHPGQALPALHQATGPELPHTRRRYGWISPRRIA